MNKLEEDIAKANTYIELVLKKDYCNCNELNTILGKHCDGSKNVAYAMQHILSDYKRVLKENEEKNKIIDLMAEFFNKRSWREHQLKDDNCYYCKTEYGTEDCKECIIAYFENKAKE